MRTIVTAISFRIIQFAWLPIGIVGYILLVIAMILFSRTSGVSSTTLASVYTRRMLHQMGTRGDEPCEQLTKVLPNAFYLALRLVTGGTILAHRLTGYIPKIYRFPFEGEPQIAQEPVARITYFAPSINDGTIVSLPKSLYSPLIIGPSREFVRCWLRTRVPAEIQEPLEPRADIAWLVLASPTSQHKERV